MTTICICGAGTMGSGIAQVSATAGFTTLLFDVSEETVQKAADKINKALNTLVEKEKLTIDRREEILSKFVFISDIKTCKADVIIEAIVEKTEAKVSLFQQ